MKSLRVKTTVWALSALWLTGVAAAQSYPNATYGSPSLLPLPSSQVHRATPCGALFDGRGTTITPPVYQPKPVYPTDAAGQLLSADSAGQLLSSDGPDRSRRRFATSTLRAALAQNQPQHELPAPQHAPNPIPQLAAPRGEHQPYENVPSPSDAPSAGYGNGHGHGHAYDQGHGLRLATLAAPTKTRQRLPWAADGGCGVAPSVGGLSCFRRPDVQLVWRRQRFGHEPRRSEPLLLQLWRRRRRAPGARRARGWDWAGGFETRFGRYFGCGAYAVEAAYWGLFPGGEQSVIHDYEVNGAA